jgi:DNA-binding transcriptional regulator YdaS (Cro superfamily)
MDASGMEALLRAKRILGGTEQALADAVNRKQPTVHQVLKRGGQVPAEWCLPIERATGGQITRHELRPDLYPQDEAAQ